MKCQYMENICLCCKRNQTAIEAKETRVVFTQNKSISISIKPKILQQSSLLLYMNGKSCMVFLTSRFREDVSESYSPRPFKASNPQNRS